MIRIRRPAIEHLEDLDALLFADRELPDVRSRIDAEPDVRGDRLDFGFRLAKVQEEARSVHADEHVLGHGLRRDQGEMLVDHPDAVRDGIARRSERDRRSVHADRALVGLVQPGEDVHQRALACPVLAEQGVDLTGAHVEVDVIVGEHAGECLDDAGRLDGGWGQGRGHRGCGRGDERWLVASMRSTTTPASAPGAG